MLKKMLMLYIYLFCSETIATASPCIWEVSYRMCLLLSLFILTCINQITRKIENKFIYTCISKNIQNIYTTVNHFIEYYLHLMFHSVIVKPK